MMQVEINEFRYTPSSFWDIKQEIDFILPLKVQAFGLKI